MRKYKIDVTPFDRWGNDSPVEYADTLAEAKKIRTRMARGQGLFSRGIRIIKQKKYQPSRIRRAYISPTSKG